MGAIGLSGLVGAAAVPIAVLAALAKDRWDACDTARLRRAQKAAIAALDRQDITEAEIATARRLLKEARGTLRIAPEAAVDPIRNGTLVEDLTRSVFGDRLTDETPGTVLAVQTVLATLFEDFRTDATYRAAFTEAAVIRVLKQNDVAFDLLSAIKSDTEELKAMVAALSRRIGVDEALSEEAREMARREELVLHLAQTYAKGNPGDFDGALRGIENALEVAAANRTPSGAMDDAALSPVLAHVDALNDAGRSEEATDALRATLDDLREEAALLERRRLLVIDKALVQAVIDRDVTTAVSLELERLRIAAPEDGFEALRAVLGNWYRRGREDILRFDLEVSAGLARALHRHARGSEQVATALTELGNVLQKLGDMEIGTERLEEAVSVHRAALGEMNREEAPLPWADVQRYLGTALLMLGRREDDVQRLEEAEAAYRDALGAAPRDQAPRSWAAIQVNLGNVLRNLGERETGTARLEQSVTAFRNGLEEIRREDGPLRWAGVQMNLANALQALGRRTNDMALLVEAVDTYFAASAEIPRDQDPLLWAKVHQNLSEVYIRFFDEMGDPGYLDDAEVHAQAAWAMYENIGADRYITWIKSDQLAEIAARRASGRAPITQN